MPYAILRFEKRKGGPASALEKHHERKKERYASNPDVDTSRSERNYHLVQPRMKYYAEIQSRIERAQKKNPKCKVRKDSVKFIDTIVTASPEFLAALPEDKVRRYFERALEFLQKEVGKGNIFSAVVHMDERNPHMHLCFVPLTADRRLSAKEVIGDRAKLVEWQDKFHDHMAEEFPELERGQAAAATRRKHIPTWLYKQSHRLTGEMQAIRKEIQNIGVLNGPKQRKNPGASGAVVPEGQRFRGQAETLRRAVPHPAGKRDGPPGRGGAGQVGTGPGAPGGTGLDPAAAGVSGLHGLHPGGGPCAAAGAV